MQNIFQFEKKKCGLKKILSSIKDVEKIKKKMIMNDKILVPLDSEKIQNSLASSRNVLQQLPPKQREIQFELDRPFRSKHYPIIHLLLNNVSNQIISHAIPNPEERKHISFYISDKKKKNFKRKFYKTL